MGHNTCLWIGMIHSRGNVLELKENYYTISDYSRLTTFSRGAIYKKIKSGKIKKIEFGGKTFVHDKNLKKRIIDASKEKEIKKKVQQINKLRAELQELRKGFI